MLDIIEGVKKIINPQIVLDICTGNHELTIKENDANAKIKKLLIKAIPEKSFAFTLDYKSKPHPHCFHQLSCYLNKAMEGINQGSDLVLMIPQSNEKIIILIFDLKSDKPKRDKTKIQLLNSELYVRYLLLMIENHYNIKIGQCTIEFQHTILVSTERNPSKKPTYHPNENKYNRKSAETYKKVSRRPSNKRVSIYLNELLCKKKPTNNLDRVALMLG